MINFNIDKNVLEIETRDTSILMDVDKFLKIDLPTSFDKKDLGYGTEVYCNNKLKTIYLDKMGERVFSTSMTEYLNLIHRVRRRI